jgi:site-specific DNA recombinase
MRTAIYARVSTVTHSQQHTIEEQINRLRARLLSCGEAVADEHIFRDEGRSGATLNRPALDRLRDQVRLGDYDRILVTSPDRLARNYVHQMLLLEELERPVYGYLLDPERPRDPRACYELSVVISLTHESPSLSE